MSEAYIRSDQLAAAMLYAAARRFKSLMQTPDALLSATVVGYLTAEDICAQVAVLFGSEADIGMIGELLRDGMSDYCMAEWHRETAAAAAASQNDLLYLATDTVPEGALN